MDRHCRHRFKWILIFMGVLLLSFASAAFAIDPPHDSLTNCDSCHSASGLNLTSGGSIDNTPMNRMCNTCHGVGQPYINKVNHSSIELKTSGKPYLWNSTWTYECRGCHNPHYQKQVRLNQDTLTNAGGWVEVGVISSITQNNGVYNVVTVEGDPLWFDTPYSQWESYTLQADQRYPFYYRIVGNTSNTLTVDKEIYQTYAKTGSPFGIAYGKMIKEEINTLRPVTNYAGTTMPGGSNTWRTIFYLNNTGEYSQAPPSAATTPGTTAICVVCHTRTKYNNFGYANWGQGFDPTINPNYSDATSNPHLTAGYTSDAKSCWDETRSGCHKPPEQGFDAGATCGECHGSSSNPMPTQASELVKKIKLDSLGGVKTVDTGNAFAGAHSAHSGRECKECHRTGMLNPQDTDPDVGNLAIEIAFEVNSTLHNGGAYDGRQQADMVSAGGDLVGTQYIYNGYSMTGTYGGSYGGGTLQCTNVYCHKPVTSVSYGTDVAPSWTQGTLSGDSGNCGACHRAVDSNPPTLGKHQKHVGSVGGPTMMNFLTCDKCHGHTGSGSAHVNGAVNWNLSAYSGAQYNGASSGSVGSITTPDANYQTCSNLYCHSNGGPVTAGGAVTYKTPDWSSSSASMTCGSCHNESNDAAANTWSYPHTKHMDSYGAYLSCTDCHNSVASSSTAIGDPSLHVNGSPQVVFNSTYVSGTADYTGTVCSNITCHSTGVRADKGTQYLVSTDWNQVGDQGCTICHKFNDTAANMRSGVANMSDVHVKHIATDTGNGNYNFNCSKCHTLTSSDGVSVTDKSIHADGIKNVAFSGGGNFNDSTYDCSNVYCHSDGKDSATTVTANWTDASSGACGTCHARLDTDIVNASGKHTRHAGNGSTEYRYACAKCHQSVVSATTNSSVEPTISDTSIHVDGTQDVSFALGGDSYSGTQCSNNYCHSNGEPGTRGWTGAIDNYTTVDWSTGGATACDSCHSKKDDASATWSSAHEAHIGADAGEYGSRFECSDCHSLVVTASTSIADKTKHVDGTKNVDISGTYGGAFNTGTGRCDNVKCHGTGNGDFSQPHWDDQLDCTGCHKFADTTANMTGATNALSVAHIRHVAIDNYGAAARDTMNQGYLSTSNDIKCDNCHNATTTDNTSITNLANHVDLSNTISFSIDADWPTHTTNTPAWGGSASKTCNNVYCHSDGMELEGDRTFKEVSWNDAPWTGTTCDKCHGLPPDDGTHNVSVDTQCSQCHPHANTDDPATGFVSALAYKHLNGFVDQEGGCTNCHGQPPESTITLVNTTISNRGTEYSPKGWGAHVKHGVNGKGYTCANCHNGGQPAGGEHKGFKLNIEFVINSVSEGHYTAPAFTGAGWSLITNGSTGLTITGVSGTDPRQCDNIYCHSDGGDYDGTKTYKTADWDETSLPLSCDSCHGLAGLAVTTNQHVAHVDSGTYGYACFECHNNTVNSDNTIKTEANHVSNYEKDVAFGNIGSDGDAYFSGTRPQCSNVYCHTQGTDTVKANFVAPVTTPAWNTGSLACDGCHGAAVGGTQIATKAHGAHVNDSGNQVGYDVACDVCHNATAVGSTSISVYVNHVDTNVNIKFDDSGINKNNYGPVYDGNTTTGATGYAKPAGSGAGAGCNNVYCHSDGREDTGNRAYKTIAWGTNTIAGCDDCHGDGGGNTHPTYASAAEGQVGANSHPKHVGDGIGCQECHYNTTTDGTTVVASGNHLDGNSNLNGQDVYFNPSNANAAGGSYTPTAGDKSCDSTYCHGTSSTLGWGGSTTCGTCHSGGTSGPLPGSHGAHFANTLANSGDWTPTNNSSSDYEFSCGICHDKNQGVVHVSGEVSIYQAGQVEFASAYNISATYSGDSTTAGDDNGYNWSAGTGCNSTYCHSNALGSSGAENPAWGGSLSSACGACHNEKGGSTPHAKHTTGDYAANPDVSDCNACHAATASDTTTISDKSMHVNLSNDVSFDTTFADPGATNTAGYSSPSCSNTYCHSDGTSADPTHADTSWSGTRDCSGCHQGGTAISTNAHGAHVNDTANQVGYDIGCTECHNATASDNTTVSSFTNHVNQAVNIKFDDSGINKNNYGPVYDGNSTTGATGYADSPGNGAGTCNNVYCHSDGREDTGNRVFKSIAWDAAIAGCDDCHGDGGGNAHPTYGSAAEGQVGANSHPKHVGDGIGCQECHYNTTTDGTTVANGGNHLDGNSNLNGQDVYFNPSNANAAGGSYTPTAGDKSCDSTYCHGTSSTLGWGGSTTCGTCHSGGTSGPLPGSHGAHFANTLANSNDWTPTNNSSGSSYEFNCGVCHDKNQGVVHVSGEVSIYQAGQVEFASAYNISATYAGDSTTAGDDNGYNWSAGTGCNSTYCHSNALGSSGAENPAWGGSLSSACGACHNEKGGSAAHTKHTTTYGSNTNVSDCNACHFDTVNDGAMTIKETANHVNLSNDISFDTFVDPAGGTTTGYASRNCNNTYCHSNGTSTDPSHPNESWDNTGNVVCSSCHDDASTPISTGAHSVHVSDTANHVGFDVGCTECHNATASDNTTVSSVTNHVNKSVNIKFDDAGINKNSYNPTYDGNSTTVANGYPDTVGNGAGTCYNVYCHSIGNTRNSATNVYNSVAWSASIDCAGCHGNGTTSHPDYASGGAGTGTANSHVQHVETQSYGCADCHNSTTTDGTSVTNGGDHLNGTENVVMSSGVTGTFNTTTNGCDNTRCHGSASDAWGDDTLAGYDYCTLCHGKQTTGTDGNLSGSGETAPGYNGGVDTNGDSAANDQQVGAHDTHLRGLSSIASSTRVVCADCHNGKIPSVPNEGTHMDGTTDLAFSSFATNFGNISAADYNQTTAYSCTNVYCHGTALPNGSAQGADMDPQWSNNSYLSGTYSTDCAKCHGFPPVSGQGDGYNAKTTHDLVASGAECSGCHPHLYDTGSSLQGWVSNGTAFNDLTKHMNGDVEYVSSCYGCHVSTSDVDNWTWDSNRAYIKESEWTSTGHGASGNYGSGNSGADFQTVAGNDSCNYCHAGGGGHPGTPNDPANYFKLRTGETGIDNTGGYNENGVCMACHETSSGGVNPGTGNINGSKKVGSRHYGGKHGTNKGGQFCWDCHDPHGDSNRYMIHLNPVSHSLSNMVPGTTTSTAVSFTANATGTDYAQNGATPTGVCNVCHTNTNHYTSSSGDSHNWDKRCTDCHSHTGSDFDTGFPGEGESTGGQACDSCHSELWNRMHDGAENMVYKHFVNSAAATYPTDSTPTPDTSANRTCLICHVDHDIFSVAVSAINNRAANLRDSITTTSYSAGEGVNSDFDETTGGICLSCHWNQQTKKLNTNNGVQNVPALPVANIGSASAAASIVKNSSHNYSVQSGAFGDSTKFAAVCMKCHNDTIDISASTAGSQKSKYWADTQNAEPRFGLHQSLSNSFLSPMGARNISDFKQGIVNAVYTSPAGIDAANDGLDIQVDYTGFALVVTKKGGAQVQRKLITATDPATNIINVTGWDWTPVAGEDLFEIGKNVTPADDICFSCHSKASDGFKNSAYVNKDFYNATDMSDKLEGMYGLFVGGSGRLENDLRSNENVADICTDKSDSVGGAFNNYKVLVNGLRGTISSSAITSDNDSACTGVPEFVNLGFVNLLSVTLTKNAGALYIAGSKVELFKPASHPLDSWGRHTPDEMLNATANAPTSKTVANNIGDFGTCDGGASQSSCIDTSKNWSGNFSGLEINFMQGPCKDLGPFNISSNLYNSLSFDTSGAGCTPASGNSYYFGSRHVSCADCHNTHAAQRKPAGDPQAEIYFTSSTTFRDTTKSVEATGWTSNEHRGALLIVTGKTGGNANDVNLRQVRQVKASTTDTEAGGTGTTYTVGVDFSFTGTMGASNPNFSYEVVRYDGSTGPGGKGVWGVNITGMTSGGQTADQFTYNKIFDAGGDVGGKQWMQCLRCHSYYGFFNAPPTVLSGHADGTGVSETDIAEEINPNNYAHHAVYATGKNQPILPSGQVSRTDTNFNSSQNYNTLNLYSSSCCSGKSLQGWRFLETSTSSAITSACQVNISGTLPETALPGWYVYLGAKTDNTLTGWYQITQIESNNQFYIAATAPTGDLADGSNPFEGNPWNPNATCDASAQGYSGNITITAGLGETFVPPYGPWAVMKCTDCHGSTLSDPLGPHASKNSWLLKSAETQLKFQWWNGTSVQTVTYGNNTGTWTDTAFGEEYLCYNCHRVDVYPSPYIAGNYDITPQQAYLSRVPHGDGSGGTKASNNPIGLWEPCSGRPGYANDAGGTYGGSTKLTKWPQYCRNCHGGDRIGGIHGANRVTEISSNTGAPKSKRFLNGSKWDGSNRPTTTVGSGTCYTVGSDWAQVNSCTTGHDSGTSMDTVGATYNYDNP